MSWPRGGRWRRFCGADPYPVSLCIRMRYPMLLHTPLHLCSGALDHANAMLTASICVKRTGRRTEGEKPADPSLSLQLAAQLGMGSGFERHVDAEHISGNNKAARRQRWGENGVWLGCCLSVGGCHSHRAHGQECQYQRVFQNGFHKKDPFHCS